ncbi:MAG: alpha-L-glutamate ligase-like protein [Verrucomicrobia bacterium]|nr:alpha-L-glutamate ligase-like protein [Verrucomicrobiota bacterium]
MWNFIHNWRELRQRGVLGINRRNAEYLLPLNHRQDYPLVDNKLKTKQLASAAGVAVPKLLGVVQVQQQVRRLPSFLDRFSDFVVKPACGSGGNGIVVCSGRSPAGYHKIGGAILAPDAICEHAYDILAGMHSLGGMPDVALIEERVEFDTVFAPVTYQGVPDIRVIILHGVPVMAMLRLPTRESNGKANLHQGAIGAGLNLATGCTMTAVWHGRIIASHPDTGQAVSGLQVPHWDEILGIASRCGSLCGLGYLGADLVLDRHRGPLLLELNARPGLGIQLANRAPLLPRLRLIKKTPSLAHFTPTDKIRFAKDHFGGPATT